MKTYLFDTWSNLFPYLKCCYAVQLFRWNICFHLLNIYDKIIDKKEEILFFHRWYLYQVGSELSIKFIPFFIQKIIIFISLILKKHWLYYKHNFKKSNYFLYLRHYFSKWRNSGINWTNNILESVAFYSMN